MMQMVAILFQWLTLFSFLPAAKGADAASAKEAFHPYFVSVSEMNYNASEKSLEISCKLFGDDLEDALKKWSKSTIDIDAEKDKQKADQWINDYVSKHLLLKADGKPLKLNYVGFEKEKEAVYCYFEITQLAVPKKLEVSNSLLYEYKPEQINIMHVTVGGKRQSQKLNNPEKNTVFPLSP